MEVSPNPDTNHIPFASVRSRRSARSVRLLSRHHGGSILSALDRSAIQGLEGRKSRRADYGCAGCPGAGEAAITTATYSENRNPRDLVPISTAARVLRCSDLQTAPDFRRYFSHCVSGICRAPLRVSTQVSRPLDSCTLPARLYP